MNLNFELPARDRAAAVGAVGEPVLYSVPADVSLAGRRELGYFVIGEEKWAYIQDGDVKECIPISDGRDYKMIGLVGNTILEAVVGGIRRIIVRVSMKHAARYAYIAQILNDKAARRPIRIYNDEVEPECIKCGNALVPGTRVCPKCMNKAAAFKRLSQVTMKHWKKLSFGILTIFSISAVSLTGPYFQKILVNSSLNPPAGQAPDISLFYYAIAGLVFGLLGAELLAILRGWIMAAVSSAVASDLRKLVFDKIQSLSLGFLTSQRAGDVMNRITADTDRIRNLIQEIFSQAILQITLLVSVSILLFRTDWQMALIIVLPAPLVALLQVYIWRKVFRKIFHKQWRIHDKANSFLHDVLSGVRVVKAFGKEELEIRKFRDYNSRFAAATIRSEKVFAYLSPISNYMIQLGMYVVLFVGCLSIADGTMNVGELVQFTGYAWMIYGPITWMMYLPRWIANAFIAIDRVFSVIDEQPEILDTEASSKHRIHGRIEFRDVTFGYKSYEPVLKNLNFEVKPGEMIGLVGHSGAGKSTLINLVSRFYDVNEGQVLIDGLDIRSIAQEDLRSQIGVVLQETFLFNGSILENIRFSKPEATREELIQAAKIANAHDFIVSFPDGYDTKLEENGNNLSGGERQRIAFARAVLGNPRILILDEATSALDINTESEIQEAMKRVTENRTTIAIAHRLATLKNADRLLVMDKGEVAEMGTHDELMAGKGIYYNLVMAQRNMNKKVEGEPMSAELEGVS